MCGIAGIYNLNNSKASSELIRKINQKQSHRGPDDESYFIHENIGLGHVRLSILDPSIKGRQPMMSKNSSWVIVFNGCIYNFKELRKPLIDSGINFISNSDTEVLVEGLAAHGIDFIKRINGMFSIGAYNLIEKKLYLCRDRYGIKPLYYWFSGKELVFASEVKVILEHPNYNIDLNIDALGEYFTYQNQFRYHTLFKGINMVPPANICEVNKETVEIYHKCWWDFSVNKIDQTMTFDEAKFKTFDLLEQAVKRQMISDVPVGSYLSGGIDSGAITSIASKEVSRLSTFTCGFDMNNITGVEANYDERKDAELIASQLKTEHYEQIINSGDLSWSLPRLVYHLEDLKMGMSYPNYYISRLASKFVKVCLQGTGGDEIFGGYPWRYYRVFSALNKEQFFNQYYDFWQRLVPDEEKSSLYNQSILSQIDPDMPRKIFERVFTFNNDLKFSTPEEQIQNSFYFELKTFLPGLLLVGDKLSMANGLEERFPFLDNNLVDFAMQIPVKYKLGDFSNKIQEMNENTYMKKRVYSNYNDGKNILRKALQNLIPTRIIDRKKQGFSAPDENWYRGDNLNYVKSILINKNLKSADFISTKFINKTIDDHVQKKKNNRLLIWSLMNFEIWCKTFLHKEKLF